MGKQARDVVSFKMSCVRAKGTSIEKKLSSTLWASGLRGYRKNCRGIIGTPDFCWAKYKVAVFCDSSFWHGYNWRKAKLQIKVRKKFWFKKIEDNIKRDKRVSKNLLNEGWLVLRFWDFEIKLNPQKCAQKIISVLDRTKNKVSA